MGRLLSLLLALIFIRTEVASAQDTMAPVLHNISISSDTLYTGDTLIITLDITDDISGISGYGLPGFVMFNTIAFIESASQSQSFYTDSVHWISGNIYNVKAIVPTRIHSGSFHISLHAYDIAGNYRVYEDGIDFNLPVEIISLETDTSPPQLLSIQLLSPDTLYSGDTITLQIDLFDSSGVSQTYIDIISDSFPDQNTRILSQNGNIFKEKVSKWAAAGSWSITKFSCQDSIGNYRAYYNNIDFTLPPLYVISPFQDTVLPSVSSVTLSPYYVYRGDTVTIFIEAEDTLSGIATHASMGIGLIDPDGNSSFGLIYRNTTGNIYSASWKVSPYAADGIWKFTGLSFMDNAGNWLHDYSYYRQPAFEVISDSLSIVTGNIHSSSNAAIGYSRVYLIKQDPLDSSIYVMRTAITDTAGNYTFYSEMRDSLIYIKAIPNDTLYPNEFPTYLDSSLVFQNARLIHVTDTVTIIDTFQTIVGVNPGGFGFVAGYVSQGAGKTGDAGDPVDSLNLILVNDQDQPVAFIQTNAAGEFSFNDLAEGTYKIWVDLPGINNDVAPQITITANEPSLNNLHFQLLSDRLDRVTGIEDVILSTFSIYPNPAKGSFVLTSSVVGEIGLNILNITGTSVYKETYNAIGDSKLIDIGSLNNGVYFVKVNAGNKLETHKLVINK